VAKPRFPYLLVILTGCDLLHSLTAVFWWFPAVMIRKCAYRLSLILHICQEKAEIRTEKMKSNLILVCAYSLVILIGSYPLHVLGTIDGSRLVATTQDPSWDLSTEKSGNLYPAKELKSNESCGIVATVFVSDGRRVITSTDRKLKTWDTATCQTTQVLQTDMTFRTVRIDPQHPNYLMTDMGPVFIGDPHAVSAQARPTSWCPYSVTSATEELWIRPLQNNKAWITLYDKKLIYLPEQYRPAGNVDSVLVQGNSVVIGCKSGWVLFFGFKEVVAAANS
jgi:hypothetical protein